MFKEDSKIKDEVIEDPAELEKMEEMWSKMFQRITDEGMSCQIFLLNYLITVMFLLFNRSFDKVRPE